jgi:uncharacterized membrane protein YgcG
MISQNVKRAAWLGIAGAALLATAANALENQDCGHMTDDQFLAALERGTCRIDLETAAGADQGGGNTGRNAHDGHDGGSGGKDGGGRSGGGAPAGGPGPAGVAAN